MRRGRPKTKYGQKDFGTPELQKKRSQFLTIEPIDLILSKGLISEEQHRIAMHFRWLYTIIFGLPSITAYDPSDLGGRCQSKHTDERWIIANKERYYEAIKKLKKFKAEKFIMNLCIFSEIPRFLCYPTNFIANNYELSKIKEGLDVLLECFCKKVYN